jgi:hypothetical protein
MRKLIFVYVLFVAILFLGCDDNLNPNGEYRESYTVNAILRCDTTVQFVTVSKAYQIEGNNPLEYKNDPYIKDAVVKIYYDDKVVIFKDTSIARSDSSRYTTPLHYYYAKNFRPEENKEYEIDVLLPNGRRLSSKTKTPTTLEFIKQTSSLLITNDPILQLSYFWKITNNDVVYVPRLTFYYYKTVNGIKTKYKKQIPLRYEKIGSDLVPVYPQPNKHPYVFYDMQVVRQAFEDISKGDPYKGNYSIVSGTYFEIMVLDENLSAYYSTSHSAYGEFSVKIDETDFTNIKNGFGIFGSYIHQEIRVSFSEEFVNSFGYALVYN